MEEYLELTSKIGRMMGGSAQNAIFEDSPLRRLLIKRARLLASAKEKLPALQKVISEREEPVRRALVYCGDGTVKDIADDTVKRQVEETCRLLGEDLHLRVRSYTSRESAEERDIILKNFSDDFLDAIVAIRCLDEGVDLPAASIGFILASTTNPRQYIQRRGRLLRRAPGKERSEIYDFIVVPPDDPTIGDKTFNIERRLFKRELKRICEFCETAENSASAMETLLPLRKKYNLLGGVVE
jgi:superfamily II DNA or RNA helicase